MNQSPNKSRAIRLDNILINCESCYPGEFNEFMIAEWHRSLAEYDLKSIYLAFAIHIKKSSYLPKINDIVAILDKGRISIEARAQDQWRLVMDAARCFGINHKPAFKDPITADLIARQITWPQLCDITEDAIKWEQKRWVEAFILASEMPYQPPALEAPQNVAALIAPIGGLLETRETTTNEEHKTSMSKL